MQFIIISGRSGSGKSTALHVLEDTGFVCIDNLPASLLPTLVNNIKSQPPKPYAVSIDARNSPADLEQLPTLMALPEITELNAHILFLDADDDVLLKRFSETRRRHPLSDGDTDLASALTREKEVLSPLLDKAEIVIDTSDMGFHDLRDLIKQHISASHQTDMSLVFQSFGFKFGLPRNSDLVFDVRCLPNPHWKPELRPLTGNDEPVAHFLDNEPEVEKMYQDILQFLDTWLPSYQANNRSYLTISIGCTGGKHRSVYLCNRLAKHFQQKLTDVKSRHRELHQ